MPRTDTETYCLNVKEIIIENKKPEQTTATNDSKEFWENRTFGKIQT